MNNSAKKGALLTVFLVVLIDLMGFGIVLPLLPFYASQFGVSAVMIGLLYSVYSFAQLIFSPFWGGLSDRIGRRPIMLISTLGSCLAYVLFGFAHSFAVLFISRLLAGMMGGNISTAQAYVADVTTPEDRAKGMGLIGAAFGIGFTIGPALSTLMVHPRFIENFNSPAFGGLYDWMLAHRYSLPGFAAALLSSLSFLMIVFKLPETVTPGAPAAGDAARVVKTSVLSAGFWRQLKTGALSSSAVLPHLLLAMWLLALSFSSLYSAFPLYCRSVLSLSAEHVGMIFVWMGLVTVLVQGGLIRVLVKRFSEKSIFITGSLLMAVGMALIPVGHTQSWITWSLVLMAFGASLNGPVLTSLISKEAGAANVGFLMGASQGLSALGRAIGPTWGGYLYGLKPTLPFVVTASTLLILVWVGMEIRRR